MTSAATPVARRSEPVIGRSRIRVHPEHCRDGDRSRRDTPRERSVNARSLATFCARSGSLGRRTGQGRHTNPADRSQSRTVSLPDLDPVTSGYTRGEFRHRLFNPPDGLEGLCRVRHAIRQSANPAARHLSRGGIRHTDPHDFHGVFLLRESLFYEARHYTDRALYHLATSRQRRECCRYT